MIEIKNKRDCCGCQACAIICPKSCIYMVDDKEGFEYPEVDKDLCIECGLCEKVCPVINQGKLRSPLNVYASINSDNEIRIKSSSGGIFTPIAQKIIVGGGVVFGACWDENWLVHHTYIDNLNELEKFRGSKYIQSNINKCFIDVRKFLKLDRKVLFSGTPCQIAGLKRYLGREYDNLLCVEVVCHGLPSPKVWMDYLKYLRRKNEDIANNKIVAISFRDKVTGWHKFSFSISCSVNQHVKVVFKETFNKNSYMKGFLNNLYLRPSCHQCPARSGKSGSDIAIADYWGVSNKNFQLDDDKGTSLVLIYTAKGQEIYDALNVKSYISSLEAALRGNMCIANSVQEPIQRTLFWKEYEIKGVYAIEDICKKISPSLFRRLMKKLKSFVR